MKLLFSILRDVPDPRTGNATRHDLLDLLVIALTASICGCESCVEFADFAEDREELFREFLTLKNGLPSHDTFSRLFRLIDPAALAGCFGHFLEDLGADGAGVLAIDGKTLRRSFDRAAGRSPLHVVAAFATEARLIVGQRAVAEGENEILAGRALLELLDLKGSLVTADALHCQAETARLVIDRGGDYLLALKANRPSWLKDIEDYFADLQADIAGRCQTSDTDHGRNEVRHHAVCHRVDWLIGRDPDRTPMPGLACIGMVETEVQRDGRTTRSKRYYLCSTCLSAERFAAAVRAHWQIENSVHWVLDTAFDEDRARNRKDHGAENLAILRKLALNILRKARPGISIRRKRKRSGWSDEFARSILGQMR